MNEPIKHQIIHNKQGLPEFVVVPYDEYIQLSRSAKINLEHGVPNQVVDLIFDKDYSAARAWREYLGLTQAQAATNLGISQSAYSQIEASQSPRKKTRIKIAQALGIAPEQLDVWSKIACLWNLIRGISAWEGITVLISITVPEDFGPIINVLTSPDTLVYGLTKRRNALVIAYEKKMANVSIVAVEGVNTDRKRLLFSFTRKNVGSTIRDSVVIGIKEDVESKKKRPPEPSAGSIYESLKPTSETDRGSPSKLIIAKLQQLAT